MPFTVAHSAAALPFRRTPFVPSALIIGTLAPDFEYFIRLAPDQSFGHTVVGTFALTLPLALSVLWLFHAIVKRTAVSLLPEAVRERLSKHLGNFQFWGTTRFLLLVISILVGIATHLLWDSFTHQNTWLYRRWSLLRQTVSLPIVGAIPYYKAFQHGSTVLGIALLSIWFVRWYRTCPTSNQPFTESRSLMRKTAIISVMTIVASVGAILRALIGTGRPIDNVTFKKFLGELIVTAIALAWWQLVAYGLLSSREMS